MLNQYPGRKAYHLRERFAFNCLNGEGRDPFRHEKTELDEIVIMSAHLLSFDEVCGKPRDSGQRGVGVRLEMRARKMGRLEEESALEQLHDNDFITVQSIIELHTEHCILLTQDS